jgi:hypothetical protein
VKYWEIIADKLARRGWSWGLGTIATADGAICFVGDAQRNDGKKFIVRGDDLLSVFVELERETERHAEGKKRAPVSKSLRDEHGS